MPTRLSHRSIVVADLDTTERFYREAFGFETINAIEGLEGEWLDRANGMVGCRISVRALRNAQGISLNLLHFERPGIVGSRELQPMHTLGPTHLNFYVRDFEPTLNDVQRLGGAVLDHTRLISPDGTLIMIFCSDPNGVRIEVWTSLPYDAGGMATAFPGIDRKFSHSGVCVTSTERSAPFYAALGCIRGEAYDYRDPPGQLDTMQEVEGSALLATMTRNGSDVIELLEFVSPPPLGDRSPRPANGLGLVNLAFLVDDIDATVAQLVAADGKVIANSRSSWGDFEQIQLVDPDGTKIELVGPVRRPA